MQQQKRQTCVIWLYRNINILANEHEIHHNLMFKIGKSEGTSYNNNTFFKMLWNSSRIHSVLFCISSDEWFPLKSGLVLLSSLLVLIMKFILSILECGANNKKPLYINYRVETP